MSEQINYKNMRVESGYLDDRSDPKWGHPLLRDSWPPMSAGMNFYDESIPLDDVAAGREVDKIWRDEVEHVSHRHYSTGFFYGPPGQYYENSRYIRDWQICAVVTDCDGDGNATLSLRNKFRAGDEVEIVGPDTRPFTMIAPMMETEDGMPLEAPKTPQMVFCMKLPQAVPPMRFVRHAVELSAKE